jgi:hypothetical protein
MSTDEASPKTSVLPLPCRASCCDRGHYLTASSKWPTNRSYVGDTSSNATRGCVMPTHLHEVSSSQPETFTGGASSFRETIP